MFSFTSKKSKENQIKMQQDKVAAMAAKNQTARFVGGEQFFQSFRDIGYGNEGQAICDISDNSIEAGATKIAVLIERGPRNRIESIAIVDNGTGMSPEWLQNSISFGGTSRENNPDGLGRYGMGLSAASIAFSELSEVFSRQDGNESYYKTCINLVKGSNGYFDDEYLEKLDYRPPEPQKSELPIWVSKALSEYKMDPYFSESGTVVVLSHFTPTRRKWSLAQFEKNLARHIGVVYHKFHGDVEFWVNDSKVKFIDPLFLTPGLLGYDLDEDRAELVAEESIVVKDDDGNELGTIMARYAAMPPTFALKKEVKGNKGTQAQGSNANSRFPVMRDYNGLKLVRNGRFIGIDKVAPVKFMNNDFNIGVELTFTGDLDEEFGLTTLKNKISLSDKAKSMLQTLGIQRSIAAARKQRNHLFSGWHVKKSNDGNETSAAEKSASVHRHEARKPVPKEAKQLQAEKAKANTQKEIERRASKTGQKKEDVEKQIHAQFENTDVSFEYAERGEMSPFVEFQDISASKLRIIFNTQHKFYQSLLATDNVSNYGREALKVMVSSFYEAMLRTKISGTEGGEHLYDSTTSQHLMLNWSESFSESLNQMDNFMENEGLEVEVGIVEEADVDEIVIDTEFEDNGVSEEHNDLDDASDTKEVA